MNADSSGEKSGSGQAMDPVKRRSSLGKWNAIRHGLLAKEIIRGGQSAENAEEFKKLLESLSADLNPQGTVEELLVEKIAISYWRERRLVKWESQQLNEQEPTLSDLLNSSNSVVSGKVLEIFNFSARYGGANDKQLYRALSELERRQRIRRGEFVAPPTSLTVSGNL